MVLIIEAKAPGRLGISNSIFKLKLALGFKSTIICCCLFTQNLIIFEVGQGKNYALPIFAVIFSRLLS